MKKYSKTDFHTTQKNEKIISFNKKDTPDEPQSDQKKEEQISRKNYQKISKLLIEELKEIKKGFRRKRVKH